MKEATFYKKNDDSQVTCTACEWHCLIPDGKSGTCGVRVNKKGKLFSLVYGQVVDAYGDWIEKKKLSHVLPGSMAFSIGTVGCNFACDFCLNWQSSQAARLIKKKLQEEGRAAEFETTVTKYGYDLPPEKVVEYCVRKEYPLIAFTYNEPTVFLEYALDIADLGHKKGIRSVYVTNGFLSEESLPDVVEKMDAVAVDLKGYSDKFYRKHCKASVDPVLRNIKEFHKRGIWMEVTTLVIPGENDSPSELRNIAEFIAAMSTDIPWHITQFSPDYKLLDKPRTPESTLYDAYVMAKEVGLKFVYFGNLWDVEKTSTYCPSCGVRLIHRDVYDIKLLDSLSKGGICAKCGEKIPGIWE